MLLVGTARGVHVCRLLPEGRLAVAHSLPRPPSAREGCLPSAAWRLRPPEAGRPASALLAVAWEADVEVYAVPLRAPARALGPGGSPSLRLPVRDERDQLWQNTVQQYSYCCTIKQHEETATVSLQQHE